MSGALKSEASRSARAAAAAAEAVTGVVWIRGLAVAFFQLLGRRRAPKRSGDALELALVLLSTISDWTAACTCFTAMPPSKRIVNRSKRASYSASPNLSRGGSDYISPPPDGPPGP